MSRRRVLICAVLLVAGLLVLDTLVLLSTENLRATLDDLLRGSFGGEISYADLQGDVRSGLELSGVRWRRGEDQEFVSVGSLRITPALLGPLFGRPVVNNIELRDTSVTLSFGPDGQLLLPEILRAPPSSAEAPQLPRIQVHGLTLRVQNAPYLLQRDVTLPLPQLEFDLAPTTDAARQFSFRAELNSPLLGALHAGGTLGRGAVDVEITRDGLELSQEFRALLSPQLALLAEKLQCSGAATLSARLRSAPQGGEGVTFEGGVLFAGARAALSGWSFGLEDLRGSVRYADGVITLDRNSPLTGMLAGAPFHASGSVHLDQAIPLVTLDGRVSGLQLDDALVERIRAMPPPGPEIARQLSIFRVRGALDIDWRVGERPGTRAAGQFALQPELDISVSGGEFSEALRFSYLFKGFSGHLHVTDLGLHSDDLSAREGSVELSAAVAVDYRKYGEETWLVDAQARGLLLDERLCAAVPETVRRTLLNLNGEGVLDLSLHAERRDAHAEAPPERIVIEPQGLALKPSFFPWRITDVRGRIVPEAGGVRLEAVSARRGEGTLMLNGRVGLGQQAGMMELDVSGTALVLDEELFAALDQVAPGTGGVLRRLDLSGRADINLHLQSSAGGTRPGVAGSLHLLDAQIRPLGTGLTLDHIEAWLELADSEHRHELILLPGATASFCGRAVRATGRCDFLKGWEFVLESDALRVDADLLLALGTVVPALADDALRPAVQGQAAARVRLTGDGPSVQWRVDAGLSGMNFAMPRWKGTRLVQASGELSASAEGVTVQRLNGVLERPAHLPPLPAQPGEQTVVASATTLSAQHVRMVAAPAGGVTVLLDQVVLRDVPLESWILGLGGQDAAQQEESWPAGLTGSADTEVREARFTAEGVELRGGRAGFRGVSLGREAVFTLGRAQVDEFSLSMAGGRLRFEGRIRGQQGRLMRLPIPELQGNLSGDGAGFRIAELGGVVFGYSAERFDAAVATVEALRQRAMENGWLNAARASEMQEDELRALVLARESRDLSVLSREDLVTLVVERGLESSAQASRRSAEELRAVLARGRDARPLGLMLEEGTEVSLSWGGDFALKLALAEVAVGSAISILGGEPGEVRGRLRGSLELAGPVTRSAAWTGRGSVQADVWNAIHLPLMLGILKAVDVTALFSDQRRARMSAAFDVRESQLDFRELHMKSAGLDLTLAPPGRVGLDGAVHLDFAVEHGGGVPLISDILGLLPSMLLDTLRVRGTLEQPAVEGGSAALGTGR